MAEEGKTEVTNRKFISTSNTYFDDYLKPNYWNKKAKDYKQILFKAGKPLQSRELNTMQSLFHDRFKTMCDIMYRNGSVVSGLSVDYNDKTVTISDGVIYWDGEFFNIEKAGINVNNQSVNGENITVDTTKQIYVYLIPIYEVINSTNDHNLVDPAIKYKIDEGVSGADRLSIRFELRAYNIDEAIPQQNVLIAAIDINGNVSLTNRDFDLIDDVKISEATEVSNGLKIRNNKTYYDVESGSGLIDGEKIDFNGYEHLNIEDIRNDLGLSYSEESDLLTNTEAKPLDVRDNPLRGCIWGDVHYDADENNKIFEMIFNGMLLPGQKVEIVAKLKSEDDEADKFVKLGEAEIAEEYLMAYPKYETSEEGKPINGGGSVKPIYINPTLTNDILNVTSPNYMMNIALEIATGGNIILDPTGAVQQNINTGN